MSNFVRIKINVCDSSTGNGTKFWYLLNTVKVTKIGELESELRSLLIQGFHFKNDYFTNKQFRFSVDEFLLPYWEESSILRDNDLLTVTCDANRKRSLIGSNEHQSAYKIRKLNTHQEDTRKPWVLTNVVYDPAITYDLCLFGTSMIKHVRIESFQDNATNIHNVFLKSISGGKILDIYNFIRARNFTNCKYMILTCGSNDCDSAFLNDRDLNFKKIMNDYTLLVDYLKTTYKNTKIFINQLVPRLKTRLPLTDFERNRCRLNEYLASLAQKNLLFISHPEFEHSSNIHQFLYDGVHIHPCNGVPVYVKEIKHVFDNNK